MTANVLDISHLTLSIEHKTILQDIDLTIGAGETVALIGESGSGKSTLAQCILGLQPQRSRLTPESRIDFLGEPLPIENDARMRRWRGCSISMIFQDPMSCLNPYLRVGTQILEALKPARRQTRIRMRACSNSSKWSICPSPNRRPANTLMNFQAASSSAS